jgi:hypothetical protein
MKRAHNFKDLTGKQFNNLTVLGFLRTNKNHSIWKCKCVCGKEVKIPRPDLISGRRKSCGCARSAIAHINRHADICTEKCIQKNSIKKNEPINHRDRLYVIWNGIKTRCKYSSSKSYKNYGGRGIRLCEEWLNFRNFRSWALASGYSSDLQIDRVNNDGNYEPENCRWVTRKQNQRNRRNNLSVTIGDITKPLIEWCEIYGYSYVTIKSRIAAGWESKDLLKPVRHKKNDNQQSA